MPIAGRPGPALEERIATLKELVAEAGRGPIPVSIFGVRPDAKHIERYQAAGASRCIFRLVVGRRR